MSEGSDRLDEQRRKSISRVLIAAAAGMVLLVIAVLLAMLLRPVPYVRPGHRSLRTVIAAQERFRAEDLDGDGALDYGTLSDLACAGLLDSELSRGRKYGYTFAVAPSPVHPGLCWMGVANPEHPDIDDRSYITNQLGVIYYRHGPTSLNSSCAIPADALELSE